MTFKPVLAEGENDQSDEHAYARGTETISPAIGAR